MKRLTAGIVGAGGISQYHVAGYRQAGIDVGVIADADPGRAAAAARRHGIPKAVSSLDELLGARPSLVSICTPNVHHAAMTLAALAAGANVFCEKPPALNAAEAARMEEAARSAGRVLMFDFNNRARPEARALMAYLRSGELGAVNSAQALWIRRCGIPGFGGWFTQKALSGGGPVIDLLHMIDLALSFMGYPEPDWVLGGTFADFAGNPAFKGPWGIPDVQGGLMDVETAAHGLVTFASGQILFVRASWAEMNEREEVSVTFQGTGGGGRIRRLFGRDGIDATAVDDCRIFTTEHGLPVNRDVVVAPDEKMGRERAVVNFVNVVRGDEEPLSTAAEAVTLMKLIDALYQSAEKHGPVKVS